VRLQPSKCTDKPYPVVVKNIYYITLTNCNYKKLCCRRTVTSALKRDTAAGRDCPDHYWDELSKRCARPIVSTLERLCPLDALTTNWTLTDQSAINRTCMWVHNAVHLPSSAEFIFCHGHNLVGRL